MIIPLQKMKEIALSLNDSFFECCNEIGIRAIADDDKAIDFKVGDFLPESSVWVDGEPTNDRLPGTCAIDAKSLYMDKLHIDPASRFGYYGVKIFIIGGHTAERGEDLGEVIIHNAKILKIIDL